MCFVIDCNRNLRITYMVIAALAWNLKAWYGLVTLGPAARRDILRMEFKRFLVNFIQIPCQIVATGRRLVFKILTYSRHLETFNVRWNALLAAILFSVFPHASDGAHNVLGLPIRKPIAARFI